MLIAFYKVQEIIINSVKLQMITVEYCSFGFYKLNGISYTEQSIMVKVRSTYKNNVPINR